MFSLSTLCYIEKDHKYLMLHRTVKKNDVNKDKWIGVGGHFEKDESPEECLLREVYEETGLTVSNLRLTGLKQFTHRNGDFRYIVLFYRTESFSGKLHASDEGNVFWIKRSDLYKYTLAEGFAEMLEVFEDDNLSENYHWFDGQWHQKNL